MDTRLLSVSGAAFALALVAGCASAPRADHYVAPPADATWILQHTDSGSFGSGVKEGPGRIVQASWEGRQLIGFAGPEGTVIAQPTGHWVAITGRDGQPVFSWDPPLGYDWPLEVGKSWTRQYKVKIHARNIQVPFDAKTTVEAHEEVTVPAGTFKAFRLRYSDTLGNENVSWFAPELGLFVKRSLTRSAENAQGPGRRETVLKSYQAPAKY